MGCQLYKYILMDSWGLYKRNNCASFFKGEKGAFLTCYKQ